jgi:hypothetical protein
MWFITLAIDRFEQWVKSLQFVPLEKFINKQFPPIDVWMVWHAYLLNPCWYEEDCERLLILQQLRLLNIFVVASIDVGKLARNQPSISRIAAWHKQTGTFFDPFDAMEELTHKQMECPRCRTRVFVPFVNDNGTGYSEQQESSRSKVRARSDRVRGWKRKLHGWKSILWQRKARSPAGEGNQRSTNTVITVLS